MSGNPFRRKVGRRVFWPVAMRYDRDGTPHVTEWGPMPGQTKEAPPEQQTSRRGVVQETLL